MGDDVLEDNEELVRSTNALGSFLRRIQLCTGKSCINPESVPKLHGMDIIKIIWLPEKFVL